MFLFARVLVCVSLLLDPGQVVIDKDEMKEIKTFGEPGITLYGFKPLQALGEIMNFRAPMFMYPNEVGCVAQGAGEARRPGVCGMAG